MKKLLIFVMLKNRYKNLENDIYLNMILLKNLNGKMKTTGFVVLR